MVANISSFYDDFNLPAVDSSKWQDPVVSPQATLTFPAGAGLQWDTTVSNTAHSTLISRDLYNMQGSSIFIRHDASFTETTTRAYFQVTRSTTGTDGDMYRCEILLFHDGVSFKLQARVYNTNNTDASDSFIKGPRTVTYNKLAMRYWRHFRYATGTYANRHYWQYSADGVTWTTLGYADGMSTMPAVRARFGYGAGGGRWTIRRVGTLKDINRGSGYLYDDFRLYPQMVMPLSAATTQFGQWKVNSNTSTVVPSPDDTTSGNNAINLSNAVITSSVRQTIRDVDVTCKVRFVSGSAARIRWRVGSDANTYWFLHLTATSAQLGYRISGSETMVGSPWSFTSVAGSTKRWRVVHVASEIVVLSDVAMTSTTPGTGWGAGTWGGGVWGGGSGTVVSSPGGLVTEMGRVTNSALLASGNVGFSAPSSVVYVDDVQVVNGVVPPAPIGSTPSEPAQVKPWEGTRYMLESQMEYIRMEDGFGNTLNIGPSYGDIWLLDADMGSPEARTVTAAKPLGNGVRSYTRFHGSKTVSMKLLCLKTDYQEAQYYSDLLQFWSAPGKKSKIVYKPRGAFERYINVEGVSLGRSSITSDGDFGITVDLAFLAVDGGDYESHERFVDLFPSTSAVAKNSGPLATEPVIRVYGPLTNFVVYQETIEGYYPDTRARLGMGTEDNPFVLAAGEFIELRTGDAKVQWMGWGDQQASRRGDLSTRDWFTLLGNTRNSLRFEPGLDGGSAFARVFWHDKY